MTTVFDRETGRGYIYDDPEEMAKAVASGKMAFKPGSKIQIRRPNDDQVFDIEAERWEEALNNGYMFETTHQRLAREYAEENSGVLGGLKTFARSAGDAFFMSVPEIARRNLADPLEWAKEEALRKEHELASISGTVLGTGANILALNAVGALAATGRVAEKTVSTMAMRLRALAGPKSLTEAQAKNIAQGLIAKSAGAVGKGVATISKNVAQGAIEGGIDMTIPAAAEALFGNFEEAGESLLIGSAFGGVLGGTIRSLGQAKGAMKDILTKPSADGTSLIQDKAVKALSTVLKRDPDQIRYALENPQRILNAPPIEELYDEALMGVEKRKAVIDKAQRELEEAQAQLKDQMTRKKQDLEQLTKKPSEEFEATFDDDLASINAIAGDVSESLDDIIARDLVGDNAVTLAEVDNVFQRVVNSIEDSGDNKMLRQEMLDWSDDLKRLYGKQGFIDGPALRNNMRRLRDKVDFTYRDRPGAFQKQVSREWQKISEGLSDIIKDHSEEYATEIAKLAPLLNANREVQDLFRSRSSKLSLANALGKSPDDLSKTEKPKVDAFNAVKEALKEYDLNFATIDDKYATVVSRYAEANEYLAAANKLKGIKSKAPLDEFVQKRFATEAEVVRLKEQQLKEILEESKNIEPLFRADLNSVFSSYTSGRSTVKWDRALEDLEKLEGIPELRQRIRDRYIADAWEKPAYQGSLGVNLGAIGFGGAGAATGAALQMLGYSTGGATTLGLMAAGAMTGAYLDRFGGRELKKLLTDDPMSSKIRGLLIAEQRMGQIAKKIDTIPQRIEDIASGKISESKRASAARTLTNAGNALINQIIQSDRTMRRTEEDKQKQKGSAPREAPMDDRAEAWKIMTERLAQLQEPGYFEEEMGFIANEIADGGGPNIAQKFLEKTIQGVSYLQQEIPKDPFPAMPFARKQKYRPSDFELKEFEDKLLVVQDPMIVFDAIDAGMLSRSHVSALQAVYPTMYQKITARVIDAITEKEIDLDYQEKIALSYVLDTPLDVTMAPDSFAFFQQSSQEAIGEEQAAMEAQRRQASTFSPRLNYDPAQDMTVTQRLGERA